MNKNIIIIIALALIIILVSAVAAQYLQSVTNNNNGKVENQQTTITVTYAGVDKTDGSAVNWTELLGSPLQVGTNSLQLAVTNTGDQQLVVRLFVEGLPAEVTVMWGGNNTLLMEAGATGDTQTHPLYLTIPDTIADGTELSWTQTVAVTAIT